MKAVVLAGGKGARLAPYTHIIPKPMMPIGDRAILEIMLLQMKRAGITDVILTVGHLAGLMRAYFQDGAQLGVNISYSYEDQPLGTAGPLGLLKGLDETFLVCNGDVLTTLNIRELIDFHKLTHSIATIASHQRQVHIDLGVIEMNGDHTIVGYLEKPTIDYLVSMGIYIFEPEVLKYIPPEKHLDFPELIMILLADKKRVVAYPFDGYWEDLGRADDYEQANLDFEQMRTQFLPEEDQMDWLVPLADLDYGLEEEEAVLKVLRSKWLTMGAITQEFEKQFSRTIGVKHAVAVSNATEALHLACLALGIGPGDEVITPSLSFVATSNSVLYTGADVRFADIIGPDELTIDPMDIASHISARTKAIIVMHYAGYPCRIKEILTVAEHFHLPVIEDAAHAPGASLEGKFLGTWGVIGCFSFFSNKNLSTGEGGMLVTDQDEVAEKVRLLRSHAMTSLTYDRHQGHAFSYDVVDLGYNYRIDELHSALGLEQLKKLTVNNGHRKNYTERYCQSLANSGVGLPFRERVGSPAYHFFPILLPQDINRKAFMDALREEGIQTSIHYPPIHRFTYYQSRYGRVCLPRTEEISDSGGYPAFISRYGSRKGKLGR